MNLIYLVNTFCILVILKTLFTHFADTAAFRSRAKQLRLNSASADELTDADTYENYDFSDAASVTGNKGGQ